MLDLLAAEPSRHRLIDVAKRLDVNKSSMFALLHTLESLRLVEKNSDDRYALGSAVGALGGAFFRQYDYISAFHREARAAAAGLGATFQLARLEGREVIYLAIEEALTPIRLASSPGIRLPAHATALGKALLASLDEHALALLFTEEQLGAPLTPYTLTSRELLLEQLEVVHTVGIAEESQEAVLGICCAAAPVRGRNGRVVAAISCSMSVFEWADRREEIRQAVAQAAARISGS